jgi:imidazolonepropionase-like amidohydrolase
VPKLSRSLLLLASALWLIPTGVKASEPATSHLRIEHVTVISPERDAPLRDATVVVHAGRIVSVSVSAASTHAQRNPQLQVIDGSGLYLSPGLIDSHVHLGSIPGMTSQQEAAHPDIAASAWMQIPRSYLLFGFTTLIDLISSPQDMARWKSHGVVPDTYFCGAAALMDGYPMNFVPQPQRYTLPAAAYILVEPGMTAPAGIDPALHTPAAVVAHMKSDGAICVKTFYELGYGPSHDLPVPQLATIRALVESAHAAGLPVLIHANAEEAQRFGLDAGVDILAHGVWHWDDKSDNTSLTPSIGLLLDQVLATHVGWQPTIQVLYGERDLYDPSYLDNPQLARVLPTDLIAWYRSPEGQWFHDALSEDFPEVRGKDPKAAQAIVEQDYAVPIARVEHATGYLASHGARLLFGTDTPSAPTYANPPGLNGWLEMHRLVTAGETPAQIFRSATLSNAQALKLDRDIGTVESGKRANLLLLRQDPRQTIDAYADIVKVILDGRVLDPAELAANRSGRSP